MFDVGCLMLDIWFDMEETILLVDDEEGIRKVLGISLADAGYTVLTAENGEKALEIFRQFNPPIVLTDIKMPGMDGIELLKKIKHENAETEVIMITGHGDMDIAIESLKHEASDFITKPVNDDILEFALKRACDKISMQRKLKAHTENLEELVREKSAKVIELERQVAVGQAVEGLSSAMRNIAGDMENGITCFNEMPCFVSIHNHEMKVVATNQLYRKRLGDKVGADSWDIYQGANRNQCPAGVTFKTGTGRRSKETVSYSDGQEAPVIVHTAPIRNSEGDVELVVEISADMTEVKRLQEDLRSTQQKYQQLFDEAPCYISVQDRDFRLVAANRRFKEDFENGTAGSHCYEVYKELSEPCHACPVAKTFEDGESHDSEMIVTSKRGDQYNVLVRTAPIRNAAGDITQVMEMSTNITEIRRLQDQLSSLGLKISSISHAIKGLLTGLDGGMYLVDSGFAKENMEQIREGWDIVNLMVSRIRSMVLDILYFAKDRNLEWERVDVLSILDDVVLTVEPKMADHHIEFAREFDPSLGEFEADAGVVRSALVNILENAVDACTEDKSGKSYKIGFCVNQDDTHIIFNVYDNGVGMDKETRENLFNLFFSSKGSKGTGLGLFISNKIIRQHGGTITVDSTPGQGSHFCIRVPKILPDSAKR